MEQLALSIDEMKYLEELGLDTSDASMHYIHRDHDDLCTIESVAHEDDDIFAYTFTDILKKFPNTLESHVVLVNYPNNRVILQNSCDEAINYFKGYSLLEEAFDMLVWCIENGYIKIK